MGKVKPPVVKRSLWSWILASNLKLQGLLLVVIVLAVFTRVFPLEMQKRIVNQAIRFNELGMLFRYCGLYFAAHWAIINHNSLVILSNYSIF